MPLYHLQPFSRLGLTLAPKRTQGLDRKYTVVGKHLGRQPLLLTGVWRNVGIATRGKYLCIFAAVARVENVLGSRHLIKPPDDLRRFYLSDKSVIIYFIICVNPNNPRHLRASPLINLRQTKPHHRHRHAGEDQQVFPNFHEGGAF